MGLPVVMVCWQIVPEDLPIGIKPDRSQTLGYGLARGGGVLADRECLRRSLGKMK
jgi:hypothetical protein